ncbi:acyltransferase [Novipirellula artificiosorum]|nr:acyltransferase [Novipirellula artificiosorum]
MIHPLALVDDVNAIGPDTNVWAFAHIMSGATVGNHCNIGDHAFIESGAVVGDYVTVKNHVLIWEGITIDDNVFLGPGVVFTNDRFPRSPRMMIAQHRYSDRANWLVKTRVHRGSSIGASATLCPGIEIGCFSMVGAGSVVTKNVLPYSLVMGSPARHVHYVCSCGQKLTADYRTSTCCHCGETGQERVMPS